MRVPSIRALLCLSASTARAAPGSSRPGPDGQDSPSIANFFIFGDSFTSNGFVHSGTQPSAANPIGNPAFPGWTSVNASNWVSYFTGTYNDTLLLTYDLAVGGATIDYEIVGSPVRVTEDFSVQVDWFVDAYGPARGSTWRADDTVFLMWFGINDVDGAWANESFADVAARVADSYREHAGRLVDAGARNLAFLNVPPVDRAPVVASRGPDVAAGHRRATSIFNEALRSRVAEPLSARACVWLLDANALFNRVLDDPASFAQTSGYTNVTDFCPRYLGGTPEPDYWDPACPAPVSRYFWLNDLHPTYPMHDLVAQQLTELLRSPPNVEQSSAALSLVQWGKRRRG